MICIFQEPIKMRVSLKFPYPNLLQSRIQHIFLLKEKAEKRPIFKKLLWGRG